MIEKQVRSILKHLTELKAPKAEIDLWPGIESRLQTSDLTKQRGTKMNTRRKFVPRIAAVTALVAVLVGVLFFTTPQGQAAAQSVLRFFTRSESNELPIQAWQLTPNPTPVDNPTANPASIIGADLGIEDVRQKADFDIYVPTWIPENLHFSGASIDQDLKIVRIFYQYFETNGLALREQKIPASYACELCDKVGADAAIQEVLIGDVSAEYVEGVWKLTEQGPVWESDPYLKTMRWQDNGIAFEMQYMGPPDTLSIEDMIAIAESMR